LFTTKLKQIIPVLMLGLVLLLLPLFAPSRYIYFAIWGFMGIMWAVGLNIFFGYCGMINFGSSGFGCLGAYIFAILVSRAGVSQIAASILSLILTGLIIYAIGRVLIVRLRHLVLGLATLAFSQSLYIAVSSGLKEYTGGEDGIHLPPLILFGKTMGDFFYYYLALITAAVSYVVAEAIFHSRTGRAMVSIREDEEAARTMGVNINKTITLAFVLSGLYCSAAALILVQWTGWISPEFFTMNTDVLVLLGVVLGGIGNIRGAVIGGAFIFMLPQVIIAFAHYALVVYGTILVLLFRLAPGGIGGAFRFLVDRFIEKKTERGVRDGTPQS
jgi:branched-chain amino acid transport system permease protein